MSSGRLLRVLFVLAFLIPRFVALCSGDDTTRTYRINDVIVTAPRLAGNPLNIPLAVGFLSEAAIAATRQSGLADVLNRIPGILAQSRAGSQDLRLTIRGFGARGAGDRSNAGTSRGIRLLIDNFPETEPDGRTSFDLVDPGALQRIEVIRSNASALWGNAAGGVVSLSTVPIDDASQLTLRSLAGNFGLMRTDLRTAGGIGSGMLFASASNSKFDGWRQNSGSQKTLFNLGYSGAMDEHTRLGIFLAGASSKFNIPGPLSQEQYDASPEIANPAYLSRAERRYNRLGRLGISFEHELSSSGSMLATAYVSPKFLQRSERGTFRDFTRYHIGGSALFRYHVRALPEIPLMLIAGADESFQDGAILFYSLSPTNDRGTTLRENKREGTNSAGIFAQGEFALGTDVTFSLGTRYDAVTYYNESYINSALHQTKTFDLWSPKVGLTYRLTHVQSLYANVGGGVEVPAGNETDPAGTYGLDTVLAINPLLEPIRSTTIEIGTKFTAEMGNAFLRTLSYDVALYHIAVSHDIIPYRGGRFYMTAGSTTRTGLEAGAVAQLDGGITLQGAVTFSSNKFIDYTVDSVHYGKPGAAADYAYNDVPGIPRFTANLSIRFEPPRADGAFIEITGQTIGRYFVDDANTTEVPPSLVVHTVTGLNRAIGLGEDFALRAHAGVNNLFDVRYAGSAYVNPDLVGGAPVYLEPGLPRNWFVSIGISYAVAP